MTQKILNTIPEFTHEARDILKSLGRVEYVTPSQGELGNILRKYDAAVVGLGLLFDREVLQFAERLKCIATATTGLDHINLDAAKEKGITVLSLRGEHEFLKTISGTAELAWGMVLALARRIPSAAADVLAGRFDREAFRGHELSGMTLGIVGLGRLGSMVARYGRAFGMRVIYSDPNASAEEYPEYTRVSFDELLKASDVISIHVHLDESTKGMFDAGALASMKQGAFLINTSRGGIVDELALIAALDSGLVGGYGADVLADELAFSPPTRIPADHPLVTYAKHHSNALILPHIGGMTAESRAKTDIFIARKLRAKLLGG